MSTPTSLASIRLIAADVSATVAFYELVTGLPAVWGTPDFAEIRTPQGTLAIAAEATLAFFGPGVAQPAANRSIIVEFLVEDADAQFRRLRNDLPEIVQEPTTMPWGNRSVLFRDPEGHLVNLFTPQSQEAKARFGLS